MRNILLIVDMQNDFIDGALGTPEAQAVVKNVVEKIETFKGDIFVTYDTHSGDYMQSLEGRYLPIPHCIKGTSGWQLNEEIRNALEKKGFTRIYKPTFGATALLERLGIFNQTNTELTIVGLCTDVCVIANALLLRTFYPELDIFVDVDCCAGTTPQNHTSALETMKSCNISLIGGSTNAKNS